MHAGSILLLNMSLGVQRTWVSILPLMLLCEQVVQPLGICFNYKMKKKKKTQTPSSEGYCYILMRYL